MLAIQPFIIPSMHAFAPLIFPTPVICTSVAPGQWAVGSMGMGMGIISFRPILSKRPSYGVLSRRVSVGFRAAKAGYLQH